MALPKDRDANDPDGDHDRLRFTAGGRPDVSSTMSSFLALG